jgi:hypothetical protein
MSMGSPGDSPITDLLVHGMQPFPSDIAAKIRKLAALAPGAIAELGFEPFEWEEGKKLDVARMKLDALLAKFAK